MTKESQGTGLRWLGIISLIVAAGLFSFLNAGERVSLNLGVTVLYRISLVGLVFGVFLLGMFTMFLFGLRHDREVRATLRDYAYRHPSADRVLSEPSLASVEVEPPPEPDPPA